MFIRVIFLLCLAVFTASAEFTNEMAADFADENGDGIISSDEFHVWNEVAFDYQETSVIMTMTGEISVSTFESVLEGLSSDGKYSAKDAADYADEDGNGEISASEFDRWFRFLPHGTDKAKIVLMFTGDIPLEKFEEVLQAEMDASSFDTGYTVQQAVDYANANGDEEIDADEFNTWYHGVIHFTAQHLEPAMAGDDGVITKDEFINTLYYIQEHS